MSDPLKDVAKAFVDYTEAFNRVQRQEIGKKVTWVSQYNLYASMLENLPEYQETFGPELLHEIRVELFVRQWTADGYIKLDQMLYFARQA